MERQVRRDPYSSETAEELLNKTTKIPKPNENENHEQVRGDPYFSDIPDWLQECRENLWMTKFLNAETHTRVLLMNYLQSLREVRIWVNTVLILTSRMTEIAKSAKGPKSQGPRGDDVLAESYFVQTILVI